jgi:hypothetical protein
MSPIATLLDYLLTTVHLVYLFALESASAVLYLSYSFAGSEYILLSWLSYGAFVAVDYFSKPLNIFTAYAKKGIFKIGSSLLAGLYLYLAYLLFLLALEEGISFTNNFGELSDRVDVSNLFWYFWILKLSGVFWKRLVGEERSRKGVLMLIFWFLNLKYEELAQPQLTVLIVVDCLRSSCLLLVNDCFGM